MAALIRNLETDEVDTIRDTDVIPKGWVLIRDVEMVPLVVEDPDTGGKKADGNKNRLELIHPLFLFAIGHIMTLGAVKYDSWNWYKGLAWSRVYGALDRHLKAWYGKVEPDGTPNPSGKDPESGRSHLWHAACCLMFLVVYEITGRGTDDRPD